METSEKQEELSVEEKNSTMLSFLSVLFDQVRLQQEVRDRWFGHYIAIIGAIIAAATIYLKFFENAVDKIELYISAGAIFTFAGVISVLFYILYLRQRRNYKKVYAQLSLIQSIVIENNLTDKQVKAFHNTFSTNKHGADSVTLLIESIITAACFSLGAILIVKGLFNLTKIVWWIMVCILALFIIIILILGWVKRSYENEKVGIV